MKYEEIVEHNLLEYSKLLIDKMGNHPSVSNNTLVEHITPIHGRVAINKNSDNTHVLFIIKELLGNDCKSVLEIGTLWGGALIAMMQSKHTSMFVSIDPFDGYYKKDEGKRPGFGSLDPKVGKTNSYDLVHENVVNNNQHSHKFELLQGLSTDKTVIDKVSKIFADGVDLLFIDGDHSLDGVLNDWNNYHTLINPGGIVVFDDHWIDDLSQYEWEDDFMNVVKAYEQLSSAPEFFNNWKEIGLYGDKKIIQRV